MEQAEKNEKDYRQMTSELINENKVNFAAGGVIAIILVTTIIARFGGDVIAQITTTFSKTSASIAQSFNRSEKEIANLAQSLNDPDINYISPAPSESKESELGIVTENGQISAISSGQVTYKQNKYVIQPGESLATVAEKVYGDRNAWVRIAQANGITNPDHIEVGMELIIPR